MTTDGARAGDGAILVVEDDAGTRRLLIRCLTGRGYRVLAAESTLQAMEALAESPVDLVLSNLWMPGPDGMSLLRSVKSIDPSIGVIMVTASHEFWAMTESLSWGAFDYITKPFDLELLLGSVERALRFRRLLLGGCTR